MPCWLFKVCRNLCVHLNADRRCACRFISNHLQKSPLISKWVTRHVTSHLLGLQIFNVVSCSSSPLRYMHPMSFVKKTETAYSTLLLKINELLTMAVIRGCVWPVGPGHQIIMHVIPPTLSTKFGCAAIPDHLWRKWKIQTFQLSKYNFSMSIWSQNIKDIPHV